MDQPRSLLGIDQAAVLGLQFHWLSIEYRAVGTGTWEHDCFSRDQIHLSVAYAPIKLHGIIHNYIFPVVNARGSGQKNFSVLGSIPGVGVYILRNNHCWWCRQWRMSHTRVLRVLFPFLFVYWLDFFV
jgi:hypothetical protein